MDFDTRPVIIEAWDARYSWDPNERLEHKCLDCRFSGFSVPSIHMTVAHPGRPYRVERLDD